MSKPRIYTRIGFSDLCITSESAEYITRHVKVYDQSGDELGEIEPYIAGYETEDGDECDENGKLLKTTPHEQFD